MGCSKWRKHKKRVPYKIGVPCTCGHGQTLDESYSTLDESYWDA